MTEDVAGAKSAGAKTTYATCAECGQVFRRDLQGQPPIIEDTGYSELAEVCPSCDALDRQGETIPAIDDDY